jgi:hypothetical protein
MAPKYIWDPGKLEEQRRFIINEMGFTIANQYDTDGDTDGKIRADADPAFEYQAYLECVRLGTVEHLLFSLDDFKDYIAGLRKI